jgi:hypothetical protein
LSLLETAVGGRKAAAHGELFSLPQNLSNKGDKNMNLFRKTINKDTVSQFFQKAYEKAISAEEALSLLKKLTELKDALPVLKNVNSVVFQINFMALNLEILDYAWVKYLKSCHFNPHQIIEQSMRNTEIRESIMNMHRYNELYRQYDQAVGRSAFSRDATGELAEDFVKQILPDKDKASLTKEEAKELHETLSWLFMGAFDTYTKNFKELKLVS